MYIHPYRGMVRMYIQLDGISTILDDQNTLTRQSVDANDTLRDPFHGPVTRRRVALLTVISCFKIINPLF